MQGLYVNLILNRRAPKMKFLQNNKEINSGTCLAWSQLHLPKRKKYTSNKLIFINCDVRGGGFLINEYSAYLIKLTVRLCQTEHLGLPINCNQSWWFLNHFKSFHRPNKQPTWRLLRYLETIYLACKTTRTVLQRKKKGAFCGPSSHSRQVYDHGGRARG